MIGILHVLNHLVGAILHYNHSLKSKYQLIVENAVLKSVGVHLEENSKLSIKRAEIRKFSWDWLLPTSSNCKGNWDLSLNYRLRPN